jgi:hypothetical protein
MPIRERVCTHASHRLRSRSRQSREIKRETPRSRPPRWPPRRGSFTREGLSAVNVGCYASVHETRFELAFPSRSSISHTRCSLIALSSPFRWHALKPEAPNQKRIPSSRHKKARPSSRDRPFLCVEHETRFELATLTLARRTRNLLGTRNRMGIEEYWSGHSRQACALTGTHERAPPC